MTIFKPIKVIDPFTGKKRVLSPEEQELMLEKGMLIDPSTVIKDDEIATPEHDEQST